MNPVKKKTTNGKIPKDDFVLFNYADMISVHVDFSTVQDREDDNKGVG